MMKNVGYSEPEIVGNINESLNYLEQDDPVLVKALTERYLITPSAGPINWGKSGQAPDERQLAGQGNQTEFVRGMLRGGHNLNNGFFIEAGAFDGVSLSNTLVFELRHNWTGLLVEPNPEAFKMLKEKHRNAWLLPQCFSTKTKPEVVEFHTAALFGGIINKDKAKEPVYLQHLQYRDMLTKWRTIKIQCFPLYTVLLAMGNPTVHYFSLDIEGLEFQVLKTIPFHKVDIKILQIEMYYITKSRANELREHLMKNGYYLFAKVSYDEIFVMRGFEVMSQSHMDVKGE